jgi:hypothetical protein
MCITLTLLVLPVIAGNLQNVPLGGCVFIGEQNLNLTGIPSGTVLSWYNGQQIPGQDIPAATVTVGNAADFYVAPSDFVGRQGFWYIGNTPTEGILVLEPMQDVKVINQKTSLDVTGKSVPTGTFLVFHFETNLYLVHSQRNSGTEGFMTIKVRAPDGTIYTSLWQDATTQQSLLNQVPEFPFYWNNISPGTDPYQLSGWATGFQDYQGVSTYPQGVYTVWTESDLNGMKENYKDPAGNDYTGKTVSAIRYVTIGPKNPLYNQLILSPGWNFVSTPKILAQGYNTGSIFSNVDMGGHSAFLWNESQNPPCWEPVRENTPIRPLYAVWIYSTSNTTVNLTFGPSTFVPGPRSLPAGWSTIGFTSIYPTTAHNTFITLQSGWVNSMGFDAINQSYEPAIFNGDPSESTIMYPTKGYWLYMRTPGNLSGFG